MSNLPELPVTFVIGSDVVVSVNETGEMVYLVMYYKCRTNYDSNLFYLNLIIVII